MSTPQQRIDVSFDTRSNEMPFASYRPSTHDEFFVTAGIPRAATSELFQLLNQFSLLELNDLQQQLDTSFRYNPLIQPVNPGGTGMSQRLAIDAIPRALSTNEWYRVELGLLQRAQALQAFITDLQDQQHILNENVLHPLVSACLRERYGHLQGINYPDDNHINFQRNELIRDEKGQLKIVSSTGGAPRGLAVMMEIRRLMKRANGKLFETAEMMAIDSCRQTLQTAIESISGTSSGNNGATNVCVLTPGRLSPDYPEHHYLAKLLGSWLVETSDLRVSTTDKHVYIDAVEGAQPVDVIINFLDGDVHAFRSNLLTERLLDSWLLGNVSMVNPPLLDIVSDPLVASNTNDFIQYYLNQQPWLAEQETFQCADDHALAFTLDNLDALVLHTLDSNRKPQMFQCALSSPSRKQQLLKMLNEAPENFVAKRLPTPSTSPTIKPDGLKAVPVALTTYTLNSKEAAVIPGGLTREYPTSGSFTDPSDNVIVKDTWIVTC